ncbi:MAG TPA: class I SAM-dependent methyltransferase [Verrucomicrobiae bacterium]|nr:class I SAM-dependent methyltransferase [Verrucomicrobiae bacterium]
MPDRDNISRVFTSRRETRDFYDKISDFYDALADHSEAPVRAAAVDMLAAAPGERILEIGSGTGHSLAAIGRAVGPQGRVLAIDLSERMLNRARAQADAAGLTDLARFLCGDGLRLPIRSRSVDAVFMTFTLELFDTPEIPGVLDECKRVLRPGGRIAVAAMSKEGPGGLMLELYEWSHRHFPNFVDCRPILLSRSVESAGFHVVRKNVMEIWVPVEIVLARI